MLKYYIVLFLIAGAVLFYVFSQDPCSNLVRTDFSNKYPDYKILSSGAGEGTPDSVLCHVSYQKPGSNQVYKDVWAYQNSGSGWVFSRILGAKE
jgi:hypothetical protein